MQQDSNAPCEPKEMAEIPSQIDSIVFEQAQLNDLLNTLHRRLESVLPPASPTATLTGISRNLDSPMGQQLNSICITVRQNIDSVRDLLDRIKL